MKKKDEIDILIKLIEREKAIRLKQLLDDRKKVKK
jgi:hypothetical protein